MDFVQNRSFVLLAVVSFLLCSCAPPAYRKHPEFETRIQNIETPGLIPPDVKIYELTAGGVREQRDDWCVIGKENVLQAVRKCLDEKQSLVKPFAIDKETQEEMEDILALYRAVSVSIQLHTYPGPHLFKEKQNHFDYSLGSIESVLKKHGLDSMIFVYGIDEISTGGRQALMGMAILVGVFTGVVVMPRAGITALSVAIVDSSGSILWYSIKGGGGSYDLREPASAAKLVADVLKDLPQIGGTRNGPQNR